MPEECTHKFIVTETRALTDSFLGYSVKRRRKCLKCNFRYTTIEVGLDVFQKVKSDNLILQKFKRMLLQLTNT